MVSATLLLICTLAAGPVGEGEFESPRPVRWASEEGSASLEPFEAGESLADWAEPTGVELTCDPVTGSWHENFGVFCGLDGSKQPQDLGINAHMGGRFHMQLGLPLWREQGIGFQLGTGLNYSDFAVGAVEALEGTRERLQSFTTVGLFQRLECGWKWGVAYDLLAENYYEGLNLGQWRGTLGAALNDRDELGVWLTVPDQGDDATFLGTALDLEPLAQASVYWRRTWCTGAETAFWVGLAEPHGQELFLFAPTGPTNTQLVYGAEIHVPLADRLAIYGQANFMTPSHSGTVDATMGLVFYPGGEAWGATKRRFAPLLPVANNSTFAVDLRR